MPRDVQDADWPALIARVHAGERARDVAREFGLDGRVLQTRLNGFFARAVQHEMDHLAGDLFIDRFSHVKKLAIRTKLKRLQAETREKLETA